VIELIEQIERQTRGLTPDDFIGGDNAPKMAARKSAGSEPENAESL
jgi:hypothetical protein